MTDLSLNLWRLEERDVTRVDGLPITTPERTIVDLARERCDPSHIKQAVLDAYAKEVDSSRLMELLRGLGPTYNGTADFLMPTIAELVATQEIISNAKSALEGKVCPESQVLSSIEEAIASIESERLRPILVDRAAEIAEQRRNQRAKAPKQ